MIIISYLLATNLDGCIHLDLKNPSAGWKILNNSKLGLDHNVGLQMKYHAPKITIIENQMYTIIDENATCSIFSYNLTSKGGWNKQRKFTCRLGNAGSHLYTLLFYHVSVTHAFLLESTALWVLMFSSKDESL